MAGHIRRSQRLAHCKLSSARTGELALAAIFATVSVSVINASYARPALAEDAPSPGHDIFGRSGSKVKTRMDSAFARYDGAQKGAYGGTIHDKWALLIGVSRYQDKTIAPMKAARNNVMLMSETLSNGSVGHFPPGHISYLLGANASHALIHGALFNSALVHMALPGDLILIYICGRTMQLNKDGDVCLCTYDTNASEPQASAINLRDLLANFRKRTQCPQIVCLLDCEPTAVNSGQRVDPISLADLAKATGVTILSANALSNSSHPCGAGTFSCFCQFLTEALKSSSGMMPIANLADFIQDNVNAEHADKENKQEVTFAAAPGSDRAADLQLGAPIHAPWSVSRAVIGHNVETLALDRPDLIETGPRKSKLYVKSHAPQNLLAVVAPPDKAASADKVSADTSIDSAKVADDQIVTEPPPKEPEEINPNLDLNSYIARAKAAIRAKWSPPRGLENRQVITTLTIQKDGAVKDTAIVSGSGNETIDLEALKALKASSPLEPLPKGAPASIELRYVFARKNSAK